VNQELKVFDKNDNIRSIIITGSKRAFAGLFGVLSFFFFENVFFLLIIRVY
jgi:hypothetical protein